MAIIDRRLTQLERRLAPLRPPSAPKQIAWLAWCAPADLDWAEHTLWQVELGERELTEDDMLHCIEIEVAAVRRMKAGELPN